MTKREAKAVTLLSADARDGIAHQPEIIEALLEVLTRLSNEVRLCGYAEQAGFEVWLASADEIIARATAHLSTQGDPA